MGFQDSSLPVALDALRKGNPVIFPTDTVYGLGVSVVHANNLDDIYQIKHRDMGKPVAWLVSSPDDLLRYGKHVPEYAMDMAKAWWPGPLTLIVNAAADVPKAFASQKGTIGLRMPDNPTSLELIQNLGCPMATTSANYSGDPAPYSAQDINQDLARNVGIVVIDGEQKSGIASTVVDCTGDAPVVVREGALSLSAL